MPERDLENAKDDSPDHWANERPETSDDSPDDHFGRLSQAENTWCDDLGPTGEETPGQPRHRSANGEDRGLVGRHVVAKHLHSRIVFTNADQGKPEGAGGNET